MAAGYCTFLVINFLRGGVFASVIGYTVGLLLFLGLYTAIAVAILKYRLYDIDVLINRTLVYGTLTATLVGVYFGGIVLLQRLFVFATGEKSTLAVVASTLLIAALFNPLRRRIQSFIDRRFYRRKYDARKTLEDFSVKLRDETDLDALEDDLVGMVAGTMQPAHVSLWLRPDTASTRREGQEQGSKPKASSIPSAVLRPMEGIQWEQRSRVSCTEACPKDFWT
jgi:hypothetical protein